MLRHCLATFEGEHDFLVFSRALLLLEGSPLSFSIGSSLFVISAVCILLIRVEFGEIPFTKNYRTSKIRGRNETLGWQILFLLSHRKQNYNLVNKFSCKSWYAPSKIIFKLKWSSLLHTFSSSLTVIVCPANFSLKVLGMSSQVLVKTLNFQKS